MAEKKRELWADYAKGICILLVFIGHSESLHSISRAFKPEHHTGTIVYRKEG